MCDGILKMIFQPPGSVKNLTHLKMAVDLLANALTIDLFSSKKYFRNSGGLSSKASYEASFASAVSPVSR